MAYLPKPKTKLDALKDKWYSKIKKSGFDDVERNEYELHHPSTRFLDKRVLHLKEVNEAYYKLCEDFLKIYKFDSLRESIIWEYHTNGLTVREIASTLRKAKILKHENKDSVHRVVKKLRAKMKELYFSELNK